VTSRPTSLRRTLAVAAAAALTALGLSAAPAFAGSSAPSRSVVAAAGKPGYCSDDTGVTVVVDFSALGGNVVVRCAAGPGGRGFTGLDALAGAGFSVAGTQRWGSQFVCRIQGRPTARESLAIPGDDSYHEDCGDTPPDTAYWGYWYAPNGGRWRYSSISAASRSTIRGGFEGWSYHLGSAAPKPPPVSATHAVSAPTSSPPPPKPHGDNREQGGQPASSNPSSAPSPEPNSDGPSTAGASQGAPTHDGGRHHDGRRERDRATTRPPQSASPARTTQQADAPKVVTALPEQPAGDDGSATAFVIGAGVLVLLGAGAGATAWRRSRRG
jgi:hypothetical protein